MSKNIVLVCSAGMSTSILVSKMENVINDEQLAYTVKAIGSTEAINYATENSVDVILLGPQVKYLETTLKKELAHLNIPIEAIKPQDYGMMNGKNVLEQAKILMNVE